MNNSENSNQKYYLHNKLTPLLELYIKDKDNFGSLVKEKNIKIEIDEEIVKNQLVTIAAKENLVETIKILVQKNCDLCYKNNLPLVLASQYGNIDAVKYLLSIPEVELCQDSLLAAAQNNHIKTFNLLLDKYKENFCIKDFYHNALLTKEQQELCFNNCLKSASKFGNFLIVQEIINDKYINISENQISDALMLATKYGTKINNINDEIKDNDLPVYGKREYFDTIKILANNINNAELIQKSVKFAEIQESSYMAKQEYIKNNQKEIKKYSSLNKETLVKRIENIKIKTRKLEQNLKLLLKKIEFNENNQTYIIYKARENVLDDINLLNIHLSILESALDKENNNIYKRCEEIHEIFWFLLKLKSEKMTESDREKVHLELQEFTKSYNQENTSNIKLK